MAYPGMTVHITVKASDLQSACRTTQLSKGRAPQTKWLCGVAEKTRSG